MTLVFIDTSFYQAILHKHDEDHATAIAVMPLLPDRVVTTEWVLVELLNGFSRGRKNRERIADTIRRIRSNPSTNIIPATTKDFARGFALFQQRLDKNWSLVDCISFQIMTDLNLTSVATFDDHFEQAGFHRFR